MRGDVAEHFRWIGETPARHAEAETCLMTPGRSHQAGNAIGQRDVVVVQKDDELAARSRQTEIARTRHAQADAAHDLNRQFGSCDEAGMVAAVIDNDQLDVLVRLGAQRRQGISNTRRTAVRRDDRGHFGRHGSGPAGYQTYAALLGTPR